MTCHYHVICRDKLHLDVSRSPIITSSYWKLSGHEADQLVGGMLFLHETKRDPSHIGGRVTGWRFATEADHPKYAREERIMLTFEALPEGREAKWKGRSDKRATESGLVPSKPEGDAA